jgi:hypothetical protein
VIDLWICHQFGFDCRFQTHVRHGVFLSPALCRHFRLGRLA